MASLIIASFCDVFVSPHADLPSRYGALKRRVFDSLGFNAQRLTPDAAFALLQFRTSHGRIPRAGVPQVVQPVTTGDTADMRIVDVFPRTSCFVQVDLDLLVIRWSRHHFISLNAVYLAQQRPEFVKRPSKMQRALHLPKGIRRLVDRVCSGRLCAARIGFRRTRKAPLASRWAEPHSFSDQLVHQTQGELRQTSPNRTSRASISGRLSTASERRSRTSPPIHISFSDRGGIARIMEIKMPPEQAALWVQGLQAILKMFPPSSPARWRWTLSCMKATSDQGATGFLRHSALRVLLRRANANPQISVPAIEQCLRSIEESEQHLKLPRWLCAAGVDRQRNVLNARQIDGILLRLCSSTQEIGDLFAHYAVHDQLGASARPSGIISSARSSLAAQTPATTASSASLAKPNWPKHKHVSRMRPIARRGQKRSWIWCNLRCSS
jgi:hypothetical protein